jgi:hypothetical protein
MLGLMTAVIITTACVQDRDGLKKLLRLPPHPSRRRSLCRILLPFTNNSGLKA